MTLPKTHPQQNLRSLVKSIVEAADDRKAEDILILKISDVSYLADYFILATGFSNIQIRAISESIKEKVAEDFDYHPLRMEGKSEGSWVLIDYGEAIVHLFLPETREYYDLESFWGHAERLTLSTLETSQEGL